MRTFAMSLLAGMLSITGCATKTIVDGPTSDTGGSGRAGEEPTFVPSDDLGPSGRVASDAGPADTAAAEDGGADTVHRAAEDVGGKKGKCDPLVDPMDLKIGMPCSDHSQCETCYCYDEAYLAPFRFCTKDCSSGPGSECPLGDGEFPEYACLKFTAKQINEYELIHGGICMPRCQSVDDCKIYAPDYDLCPAFMTTWRDATVQAARTCQIESALESF